MLAMRQRSRWNAAQAPERRLNARGDFLLQDYLHSWELLVSSTIDTRLNHAKAALSCPEGGVRASKRPLVMEVLQQRTNTSLPKAVTDRCIL